MPLVFHDTIAAPGEWGLWRIDESEDDLRARVSLFPKELQQIGNIRGEERRREFLAARLLLHQMSGRPERAELIKDEDGKPHLSKSAFFVSISHTVGYSAAIAHPNPCGIDVQRIVPRIRRLAGKFVNPHESKLLHPEHELLQLHLIWSAKEAMYKAYGRRRMAFNDHLFVDLPEDFNPTTRHATARLRMPEAEMDFKLQFRCYEDFVLVAAVEYHLNHPA